MPRAWLVRGGTIITMDDAGTELAADLRIREGLIVELATGLEPASDEVVVDATGMALLPGFVQTHIHLCQTLFRNLADDLALLDWLRQRIWPLEAAHDAASLAASAELGIAELLLGGTTGIVDMGTVHHTDVIFEALAATGLRAVAGKCMMDAPGGPPGLAETTADSLAASRALAARWDGAAGGRIRYGYAPRFALSCSDELLTAVAADAAASGLWVHSHASENVDETALVRLRSGGVGNVAFFARLGIRGPRAVLAHCIHLDPDEVDELAAAGTRVAHCVSSNLKLGSGVADVPGLVAAGVHVSLGADGAPCNNRLDAFSEMRLAALIQKPRRGPTAMPAAAVLRMATRSGAEVLGLGDRLGQLRPGFIADLQVVDLRGVGVGPGGSLASRMVYAATPQCVRHVWVDGHRLVADGRLVRRDADAVARTAASELTKLLARAGVALGAG